MGEARVVGGARGLVGLDGGGAKGWVGLEGLERQQ